MGASAVKRALHKSGFACVGAALVVVGCGGRSVDDRAGADASSVVDAAATDAAARPWTGVCNLGDNGLCSGDPQCCGTPVTARRVDLASGTVGALEPISCLTTPTDSSGLCQGKPSTGDYTCFTYQVGSAPPALFVSMYPPSGLVLCDDATRARVCMLDGVSGLLPCE